MELHYKIRKTAKISTMILCAILLFYINKSYLWTQVTDGVWIYSAVVIFTMIILHIMHMQITKIKSLQLIETSMIIVALFGAWIVFGYKNGYTNLSFHICHILLILLSYNQKKPVLGKLVYALGNFGLILAYQTGGLDISIVFIYMVISLGAIVYAEHISNIVKGKQQLQKKVDELETLYAITKVLDSFPDLSSILKQITRIVTYGIGVDVCAVLLYSQESGELELQARFPEIASSYSLSPEIGLAGDVFRTGDSIICGNLNDDLDLLERIEFKSDENAIGIFPLEHHDVRFGVLLFTNREPLEIDSGINQVMNAVASTVSMVVSNAMHHETVAKSAQMDELTGLYNRAFFYDSLENEVRKARFTGQSVYVLILDIDKFKSVNDTYGHLAGDKILEQIGTIISTNTRKSDIASRYGGEEFALVLPNSCHTAAEHLAERIRRSVERITSDFDEFSEFSDQITLSVGIACYPHCAQMPKQIVDIADKRMYAAKRTGGNQYLYE